VIVVAHRACPRYAAENSIDGIRKARELGAGAVEIDVRRTLDGVPILMHDRTAWRTARCPWPVRLMPSGWVRRLRLRGSGAPVPTLRAALAALPAGLSIAIDVKHASATDRVVAEVLRGSEVASRVMVWSGRAKAVRVAARALPGNEVSLSREATSRRALRRFLDDAVRLGARGISARWAVVTADFLDRAHACGLRVYSWCEQLDWVAEKRGLPLDGVITDWPVETVQLWRAR